MKIRKGYDFSDVLLEPQYSNVSSRTVPDLSSWFCKDVKVSIPIIGANMDVISTLEMKKVFRELGGGFIHHRFVDKENIEEGDFVTVGVRDFMSEEWKRRVRDIDDKEGNYVVDIAHAHCKLVEECCYYLKEMYSPRKVIVGNVATKEAVRDLCKDGVDGIKVGVGPGFACKTRAVCGVGNPQLSAINDAAEEAHRFKVSIIGDGGITSSSDIMKALAAGADTVMIGNLLAGTDEADGDWYNDAGEPIPSDMIELSKTLSKSRLCRVYWGQSSEDFQIRYYGQVKPLTVPEGEKKLVPYSGPALKIIEDLLGGIRTGLTYLGSKNIQEAQKKAVFIETTTQK